MTKTIKALKTYLPILLAVVVILFLVGKSAKLTDKYSRLKGEYQTLEAIYEVETKRALEKIAVSLKVIEAKDAEIRRVESRIKARVAASDKLGADIFELEKKLEQAQAAGNKDKQIIILTDQVATWKNRFFLARAEIDERDKIIFSLAEKYSTQVKISNEWKISFEREQTLRLHAEKLLTSAEWKMRRTRLTGTIKTVAIAAGVGYIAYRITKHVEEKRIK